MVWEGRGREGRRKGEESREASREGKGSGEYGEGKKTSERSRSSKFATTYATDSEELFFIETSCNTNSWPAGMHAM